MSVRTEIQINICLTSNIGFSFTLYWKHPYFYHANFKVWGLAEFFQEYWINMNVFLNVM